MSNAYVFCMNLADVVCMSNAYVSCMNIDDVFV